MLQCGSRISIRLLQMQTKAICCNLYTSYIEGTVSRRGYKNMGMRTRVEPTVLPPLILHFLRTFKRHTERQLFEFQHGLVIVYYIKRLPISIRWILHILKSIEIKI